MVPDDLQLYSGLSIIKPQKFAPLAIPRATLECKATLKAMQ